MRKPTMTTDIHLTDNTDTRFKVEALGKAWDDTDTQPRYILRLAIPSCALTPLTVFADEHHLTQLRDELLARFPLTTHTTE